MGKSFGVVEGKLLETDFFLRKLEESSVGSVDWQSCHYYFSAFISSARSITFALQASIHGNQEIEAWYKIKQEELRANKMARFFLEARNFSEHVGYYPICSGQRINKSDSHSEIEMLLYFDHWNTQELSYIPEMDVVSACNSFYITLLEVIRECYVHFGHFIDPKKYYTVENINRMQMSVGDLCIELGLPEGWVDVGDLSEDEKLALLLKLAQRQQGSDYMDEVFAEYLGTDRFGEKIADGRKIKSRTPVVFETDPESDMILKFIKKRSEMGI